MSANEISNAIAAMITFHGAATTGAIVVYRTLNVDELAAGTTRGVERVSAGRYIVHLVEKLVPPTHPSGPNIVGIGNADPGFVLGVSTDTNGNLAIFCNTDAGAPSDAAFIFTGAIRFPTG